jgi:hypothetical protein
MISFALGFELPFMIMPPPTASNRLVIKLATSLQPFLTEISLFQIRLWWFLVGWCERYPDVAGAKFAEAEDYLNQRAIASLANTLITVMEPVPMPLLSCMLLLQL